MGLTFWKRAPRLDTAVRRADVDGLRRVLARRDVVVEPDGRMVDVAVKDRRRAVDALAGIEGQEALGALAEALDDPSPTVRMAAAQALAGRPEQGALELLAGRLLAPGDWSEGLAEQVAALVTRGDLPAEQLGTVTTVAIEGLRHEDEGVRARAELCLLAATPPVSGPRLVAALEEREGRPAVLETLGKLHDSTTLEAIERFAGAGEADVRRAVAVALGELKDPRGLNTLIGLTADPEYAVRDVAIRAVNEFGTAAVIWGIAGATQAQVLEAIPPAALEAGQPAPPPSPPPPPPAPTDVSSWRTGKRGRGRR